MKMDRLWSPSFVIIVAFTLFCFMMGQGSNAGTSVYLERTGSSTVLAGIGALTFSVAAAIARIFAGGVVDSRGRKIVMLTGAAIMLIGTVGPLVANQGAPFIIWRALQGLGFSAATTASATAAADVLPLSRLGEGIGYYGLGQAVSMSIGPALAIFLVSTEPPENFYFGLIACAALALICAFACRYEQNPQILAPSAEYRKRICAGDVPYFKGDISSLACDDDASESTDDTPPDTTPADEAASPSRIRKLVDQVFEPAALPGTIPMLLISTAFGFGIFYMGLYGDWLQVGSAGLFYTVSAISMIAIRLTSGRFMDKVKPKSIMAVAVVAGVLCYFMMLGCPSVESASSREILFYLAGIPYGLSLGLALPVNQTVAVRLSPPDRWGAANGLFLLGNDVAIGVASLLFGVTNQYLGFPVTIAIVIVMISLSMVAAAIVYPNENV